MADASAAAERLLRVERDDRVPVLPDALGERVATEADAAAQSPDAYEIVEVSERRRYPCGDCVGVVEKEDGSIESLRTEQRHQLLAEPLPLRLLQVRRVLDDALADDAGEAD